MSDFVEPVLATFFLWLTVRYALETYAPGVFTSTRVVHPLAVVALPLYVLWPDYVAALAVAGAVGLLVGATDRLFGAAPAPVAITRPARQRGGLPPLP